MDIMEDINNGDIDRVKELLDSGVDPNIEHRCEFPTNETTPLIYATMKGRDKIVRLLLDSKAKPNIRDSAGITALRVASSLGYTDIVKILFNYDIDINIRDNSGMTALMLAAWDGEIETARLLLKHGADIDIQDDSGKTSLMIAEKKGHDDIAKLIKDTIVSRENAKKMVRNKQVLSISKGINDKNSTVQNLDLDVFRKVMDYVREQKTNEVVLQSETQRPQSEPDTAREERMLTLKKRLNHVKNQPKGGKRNIKKRNSKKLTNKKGGKRSKHSKCSKRNKGNNKKGGKHKKRSNKRINKK
tara:strand:+ start:1305 stop:2207 length:903 start_codon:yes stop_codon:yes gene_type:complete